MRRIVLMIVAAIALVSCGTSGKVAQKSVKTYVQPGSELLGAPNVLRAWAMGISDSEMTAKKKAMASATAELSRMLNSVVTTTIEDYCVSLSEGEVAAARERYGLTPDDKVVAFAGNLSPVKNVLSLPGIFKEISDRYAGSC